MEGQEFVGQGKNKNVAPSGFGPRPREGGSNGGLLSRSVWLRFKLPLRPTTGAWHPSGRDVAVLGLVHHESNVVDNIQPLGIVVGKVVEVRRTSSRLSLDPTSILHLFQVLSMRTIPPREAHNDQEDPLGPAREDVGPRRWALRRDLFSATPLWLDPFPPPDHLSTKTRDREGITPRRLVGVLEVFFDLGWPFLVWESCAL